VKDNRQFINALLRILRTDAPWRDLPPDYGGWKNATGDIVDGAIKATGKTSFGF
jgi:transposase